MVIPMKKILTSLALLSVLGLTGCADYKEKLVCKKDGKVVYDSGPVDQVYRNERSDSWTVGWGGSYQPEPGSACQAYWFEVQE
jgi:hypothetical protein